MDKQERSLGIIQYQMQLFIDDYVSSNNPLIYESILCRPENYN